LLLFDYDGTLTPIVARPEDAVLDAGVRDLLAALAAQDRYIVGMVSGRGLEDLEERAAVPGLIYAGNHGLEICGPDLEFVHPGVAASSRTLDEAFGLLTASVARFPGARVEHKGASLTVHFRAVADAVAPQVEAAAEETVRPLAERKRESSTRGGA
jgi:trehalose 6-phosphate phosphatase